MKQERKLNLPGRFLKGQSQKKFGPMMTILLCMILISIFAVTWSLFISGPSRLHEVQQEKVTEKIKKEVPSIQGLSEHIFDYVTYNGYTEDTLYWFDQKGDEITTRPIGTLDYDKAKQEALDKYQVETKTIQLTFGYNMPCYEIIGSNTLLLLDYDSLTLVYQREVE